MFYVRQLAPSTAASSQYAHRKELLEQEVFVFSAERVGGVESREAVRELPQRAA